jgi:6,7-dimethyl-8-ribityllumazine synthase
MKIAIILSQFNKMIIEKLYEGTVEQLIQRGVNEHDIKTYPVPGSIELPFVADQLAQTKTCDAIILLGAVIRGETDHYDFVCQSVTYAHQKVALKHDLPIIFGVLTTQNVTLALDRVGGEQGHKGHDFANAAIDMIDVIKTIRA